MARSAALEACPQLSEPGYGAEAERATIPVLSDAEARVLLAG